MTYPDLEAARARRAALARIVGGHAGDAPDPRALRRVLDLCGEACRAVADDYFRGKLRLLEETAAEMLSHGGRRTEPRTESLRRRALDALELLESRLYNLELARNAARRGAAQAVSYSRL